ncbi:unnamed protein product, partial [Didymodactylos carnosus]
MSLCENLASAFTRDNNDSARYTQYRVRLRELLSASNVNSSANSTDDIFKHVNDLTNDDIINQSHSSGSNESSDEDDDSSTSSSVSVSEESMSVNEEIVVDPLLYENGDIHVSEAISSICNYIAECKLNYLQQKKLIDLIYLLIPKDNKLNRRKLSKQLNKPFIYKTLCNNCTHELNLTSNVCSNTCKLNSKERNEEGVIEQCINDLKSSISDVAQRNLHLITTYPSEVERLLPNDILNADIYKRETSTNSLYISLQLHSDGIDLMTTKHKNCYLTTGTILEIPPSIRDLAKNKILLSLYIGKKQPSIELMYGTLIEDLISLMRTEITLVDDNKKKLYFKFRCQGDKNDLPCRAVKWKISQFNGYFCCTNCKQHGETRNTSFVYYPYTDRNHPRSQNDFLTAAQLSESRTLPNQIAIVEDIKGYSPLLRIYNNVSESALFDYMHAVCGSSGHIGHLLRKWLSHVKSPTATAMTDFVLNILAPHDTKVTLKPFSDYDWWKSKESKFFLLYISMPMVVKLLPAIIANQYVLFFIST